MPFCSRCGREGHYPSNCKYSKDIKNRSIVYAKEEECKVISRNACFRCVREGHWVSDCYAAKHINGSFLS